MVGSYGAKDRILRGRAQRLESALDSLGVAHDVKEYPQAGHSFLNRLKVGPLTPLLHVTGFAYDEEAAENAWQRILAFFGEYLS